MIKITPSILIEEAEVKFTFIRSPGPGGQNVNKVATGVQLRFNVTNSPCLPEEVRQRLLLLLGKKLTATGDLIIKANCYRTQSRNKQDALSRLQALIQKVAIAPKKRKKTKPSLATRENRLETKKRHSKNKALRRNHPKDRLE